MPDIAITAAISGLKSATEMAAVFIKLRDISLVQNKVIELQSAIVATQSNALAAQSENFSLLNEKRTLENKSLILKHGNTKKIAMERSNVLSVYFPERLIRRLSRPNLCILFVAIITRRVRNPSFKLARWQGHRESFYFPRCKTDIPRAF
jgi:hypothetical protein